MAAQVTSVAVSTSFSTSTLLTPFTRTATSLIAIPTEYTTDSTRVGPLGDTIIQSDLVVPTVSTSTLETLISHIRTIRTSIPVNTVYSLSTVSTSTPSTTTTSTTMAAQRPGPPGPPGTSSTTSSGVDVVIVTAYTTITPSSTSSSRSSSSSSSSSSSVRGASAGADRNAGTTSSSSSTGGLSTGAIAGIAVGGLAAILIVALVAVLCIRRKRRDSRRDSSLYAHAPSNEKLAEDPSGGTFDVLPRNAPPTTSGGGGYNYAALGSAGAVLTGAAAGAAAAGTAARRQSQQKLTNQQRQSATRELAKNARPTPPPVSQLQYARPASQQPNTMASGSGSGYGATPIAARWASQNNLAQEQEQRPMPSHIARVQAHDMGQQQAQPHQQPIASTSAAAAGGDAASQLSRSSTTKSIAPELLGKGAGYASPMPPMGPDGKILDQKTFRERQSLIAQGFNPAIDLTAEQKMRRDSQLAVLQDQAQRRTSAAIANQKQGGAAVNNSAPGPASPPTSPPPAVVSPTRRVSAQQVQSQPRQQPQPQYPSYQPQTAPQQQIQQSRLSDVIPGPPPSSNNPAGPSYQNQPPTQSLPPVPQQQRASYQIYQPQSAAAQPPIRASLISPPGMRANGHTGSNMPSPPFQSQCPSPPSSDFSPPRTQSYQMPPGAAASPYQQYSYNNESARSRQHQTFADDVYGGLTSGLSDRDIARLSRGGPSAPPRK